MNERLKLKSVYLRFTGNLLFPYIVLAIGITILLVILSRFIKSTSITMDFFIGFIVFVAPTLIILILYFSLNKKRRKDLIITFIDNEIKIKYAKKDDFFISKPISELSIDKLYYIDKHGRGIEGPILTLGDFKVHNLSIFFESDVVCWEGGSKEEPLAAEYEIDKGEEWIYLIDNLRLRDQVTLIDQLEEDLRVSDS